MSSKLDKGFNSTMVRLKVECEDKYALYYI